MPELCPAVRREMVPNVKVEPYHARLCRCRRPVAGRAPERPSEKSCTTAMGCNVVQPLVKLAALNPGCHWYLSRGPDMGRR